MWFRHSPQVFKQINWDQVIDKSVYKGSGFRIPWSYKKGKHITCGGQGCSECENTGKITESPYLPIFKYIYGPVLCLMNRVSQEPSVDILKDSIIRTLITDVVTVPAVDGTKKKEGSFTNAQMKDEFKNSEAVAHLETFIRKIWMDRKMPGSQEYLHIRNIF